jgi:hypothetical protein
METRIGITKNPIFNTRNLLIVAVLVSAVTGGNLWLHRGDPAVGYARYTGFGFTLEYSLQRTLRVEGFGGWAPTESGGTAQAALQGMGLDQYGVIWATPESMPTHLRSLEGSLDYLFGLVGMDGTQITERGTFKSMTKEGHETIYQTFTLMEQGFPVPGIMGTWFCEDVGKYIQFYLVYLPDPENPTVDPGVLEQKWLGYLDLLTCP